MTGIRISASGRAAGGASHWRAAMASWAWSKAADQLRARAVATDARKAIEKPAAARLQDAQGAVTLHTANVGDSRVLLARRGEAVQLTTDHIPDDETERKRIEKQNPNPKMPLVRYVGETWRVGGLLALSRAFGDVRAPARRRSRQPTAWLAVLFCPGSPASPLPRPSHSAAPLHSGAIVQ